MSEVLGKGTIGPESVSSEPLQDYKAQQQATGPVPVPTNLADLLELALCDLAKVERDSRYVVQMRVWHTPSDHGPCMVCLAGSVIACSLGVKPSEVFQFARTRPEWDNAINALDDLRNGNVGRASEVLHVPTLVESRYIPEYHLDRDAWWQSMRQLLAELRAEHPHTEIRPSLIASIEDSPLASRGTELPEIGDSCSSNGDNASTENQNGVSLSPVNDGGR